MRGLFAKYLLIGALALLFVSPAVAQFEEEGEGGPDPFIDPTVAPLVMPTVEDFVPAPDGTGVAGADKALPTAGVSTYIEVTSNQKSGLLTPYYRFTPSLALKARVPLIFQRTFEYWGDEVSTSGLGDVVLDGEYTKALNSPGAVVRFQFSAKLPTGDEEKTEEENGNTYGTPLGTGSLDLLARGQFAKSTPTMGYLAAVLYRMNGGQETIQDNGANIMTTTVTNGDQIVASLFGRKKMGESFWVHLGASATLVADGKSETTNSDGSADTEFDMITSGTLVDLYPGVSYAMGKLNPFLGARIPVVTEWDNEYLGTERDPAFIFQFSYSPAKMAGH